MPRKEGEMVFEHVANDGSRSPIASVGDGSRPQIFQYRNDHERDFERRVFFVGTGSEHELSPKQPEREKYYCREEKSSLGRVTPIAKLVKEGELRSLE
jgi:hypothetical protein